MKINRRQLRKIVENAFVNEQDFFGYQNQPGFSGTTEFGFSDPDPDPKPVRKNPSRRLSIGDKQKSMSKLRKSMSHTVEKGDTLSAIAQEYYGDAAEYKKIKKSNKLKTDKIKPGQVLTIDSPSIKAHSPEESALKDFIKAARAAGYSIDDDTLGIDDDMQNSEVRAILTQVNNKHNSNLKVVNFDGEKKRTRTSRADLEAMDRTAGIRMMGMNTMENRVSKKSTLSRRQLRRMISEVMQGKASLVEASELRKNIRQNNMSFDVDVPTDFMPIEIYEPVDDQMSGIVSELKRFFGEDLDLVEFDQMLRRGEEDYALLELRYSGYAMRENGMNAGEIAENIANQIAYAADAGDIGTKHYISAEVTDVTSATFADSAREAFFTPQSLPIPGGVDGEYAIDVGRRISGRPNSLLFKVYLSVL